MWVVFRLKVLLVIIFGIPPLTSWQDLGDDSSLVPFLIRQLGDLLRDALLLFIVIEDARSVLGPDIWALLVLGGRIMDAVEELDQLSVGHLMGIKHYLQSFCVCSRAEQLLATPILPNTMQSFLWKT